MSALIMAVGWVMTTLTVTSGGQVTLREDVLKHLGIRPGEQIDLDLLPGGQATVRAARGSGSIAALAGCLKDKTNGRVLTIEEINEAIAEGGARAGVGAG